MKKRVSIQTQRRDNDDGDEFSCLYYQAKLERPTFACAYETNLLSKVFPSGKTTLGSTFLYSKRVPTTTVHRLRENYLLKESRELASRRGL
jgi:hypothetical protein